jgi:hypothetical protein
LREETIMEPISTAIVGALVAGAAASLKGVASEAVKDAYAGLKALIVNRYKRAGAVAVVEEDPDSEAGKQALGEALAKSGAVADPEVQKRAAELDGALQALPAEAKATLEVQLKAIEANRSILLERLSSTGSVKVDVAGAKAGKDFVLRGVTAGSAAPDKP